MNEPKRIPLTDNPRIKEPKKIRLISTNDDRWELIENNHAPPILAKNYEDNIQNDSEGIQKLETDKTN